MAVDIVPVLFEKIESDFLESIRNDKEIVEIYSRVKNGTATHIHTQQLADRLGVRASNAFTKNIYDGVLPDNTMYYNIASRTVGPVIGKAHAVTNEVANAIQLMLNQVAGIGINPINAVLNIDRVDSLIGALTSSEGLSDIIRLLGEPLTNLISSFANEYIKANADFAYKAGLSTTIVRELHGDACDWCVNLAGTYRYPDTPKDVYRRHDYCRCTVTYTPTSGRRQDVWSKAKFY